MYSLYPLSQDQPIDTSKIEWIRMGTTVATNALLGRIDVGIFPGREEVTVRDVGIGQCTIN